MVYNEYSKDTNAMRRVLSSLFHGTMGAEKWVNVLPKISFI
jgi:hypothetical protein